MLNNTQSVPRNILEQYQADWKELNADGFFRCEICNKAGFGEMRFNSETPCEHKNCKNCVK